MIQDDYLLRQIFQILESAIQIRKQFAVDAEDLDSASLVAEGAKQLTGMSLETIDRLPAAALIGALGANQDHFAERTRALAELLVTAAIVADRSGSTELAESRRRKADALRQAVE